MAGHFIPDGRIYTLCQGLNGMDLTSVTSTTDVYSLELDVSAGVILFKTNGQTVRTCSSTTASSPHYVKIFIYESGFSTSNLVVS
jgi:hypothetical protein